MFAIVDVETTGLNPDEDRIVEVSIVDYDGENVSETFSSLINPEKRIPGHIARITGISDADVADAPHFFNVAKEIVRLTEHRIIVAHNARFDYSFLRMEFQRLGYNFRRRQLCTLRLSRSLLPDLRAHNLNYLTRHLGIEMPMAHRAEADALATLEVFRTLQQQYHIFGARLEKRLNESLLPPGVTRSQADKLPEETGVYFFYDQRGGLLYVGKSTNIRKRVLGHFSGDIKSPRARMLKEQICHISYEVTGSELIALLFESHLIKTRRPSFNIAQRQGKKRYGLFVEENSKGYLALNIRKLENQTADPLIKFSQHRRAEEYVLRLCQEFELCYRLCGLDKGSGPCFQYHIKRCAGACIQEETAEAYNLRARSALRQYHYQHTNFIIVDKGRTPGEKSAIIIENGHYLGYAFFEGNDSRLAPEDIKPIIEPRDENFDVRKIINAFVERNESLKIIPY